MEFLYGILNKVKITQADETLLEGREHKVKPSEKALGILPPELQSFYTLFRQNDAKVNELQRQAGRKVDALGKNPTNEDIDAIVEEVALPLCRNAAIAEMFWSCVRAAIPGAAASVNLGIREGWQVVTYKDAPRHSVSVSIIPMGNIFA